VLLLPRADFQEVSASHPEVRKHLALIADQRRTRNEQVLAEGSAPAPADSVKPV
jgi:hypothetical protein